MGYESQRATIEGYIQDNWSTTPIEFEAVELKRDPAAEYISVRIVPGDSGQLTLGENPLNRNIDILEININVPHGNGTKTISEYADTLKALFENKNISGLIFRNPESSKFQVKEFIRWTILFEIQRDECNTTVTQVTTPVGSFSTPTVTFSCETDGATIYYTTDGTVPTASSTEYIGAVTITETTAFKVIAIKSGLTNSVVLNFGAYIAP